MADSQYNGETRVQVLLEYLQVTATVQISTCILHSTSVFTAVQISKSKKHFCLELYIFILKIVSYLEIKKNVIVQFSKVQYSKVHYSKVQ